MVADSANATRSASRPPGGGRWGAWLGRTHELTLVEAGIILALFLAGVLLWSYGAFLLERWLGDPVLSPHVPKANPSLADAIWHLLTAALLALGARHRVVAVLAPALALGLDIDHLFGSVFPTVVGRQAHALAFVALIASALYLLRGRAAGLVAAGAVLAHIGVDGGSFPLFAPGSVSLFALNLVEQGSLLAGAALLFTLAVRDPRELARPRVAMPLVASVLVMAIVLAVGWPFIEPFTRV